MAQQFDDLFTDAEAWFDATERTKQAVAHPMSDALEKMFAKQRELAVAQSTPVIDFSQPLGHCAKRHLTEWVKEFATCIMQEGAELMDWVPWKHWSIQPGNKTDIELWSQEHLDEIRMEVIDAMHFVMEAWLLLGGDAESFYEMYMKKHGINVDRHESRNY